MLCGGCGRGRRRCGVQERRRPVLGERDARVPHERRVIALFVFAPRAAAVRHTFFNPQQMKEAFLGDPSQGLYSVGKGLILNIEMFLIAEVLILFCALLIAVLRQLRNPVLFPFRIFAVVYTDVFRGVPLIIVDLRHRFGLRPLHIRGISTHADSSRIAALGLSCSAYWPSLAGRREFR